MTGAAVAELDDELCTWPEEPLVVTRRNVEDQWPTAITPLTQELVFEPCETGARQLLSQALGLIPLPPPTTTMGCYWGWVYVGLDYAAAGLGKLPGWSPTSYYEQYLSLPRDESVEEAPAERSRPLELLRIGATSTRSVRAYPANATRYQETARRRLAEVEGRATTTDDDELVALIRDAANEWPDLRLPLGLAAIAAGVGFGILAQLTAKHAHDDDLSLARSLVSNLGDLEMTEFAHMIDGAARGSVTIDALISRFGFRGPNEYELAAPTWGDDREALERVVEATRATVRPAKAAPDGPAGDACAVARGRAGARWPLIAGTLRWLQPHLRWRENAKVHEAMHASYLRTLVREAGRRLEGRAAIDAVDDVFFLRRRELFAELSGRRREPLMDAVNRRRDVHERARGLAPWMIAEATPAGLREVTPARLRSLGLLPADRSSHRGGPLQGEGVSAGRVDGRAVVVTDPFAADLEPGDVLIAHSTDPAWVPLFALASAVVLESGGLLSHGAMLAREFGIPCVVNLPGVADAVRTGDRVAVDGTTGVISVLA